MPLKLLLDTLTRRTVRTPLVMKSDGRTWTFFSDTFVDPVTRTVMLRPQVLHPTWYTSAAGAYARLARANYQKADTTALPAADWVENPFGGLAGNIYLENKGVNYAVFTASQSANQPMFLSFYVPQGTGQSDTVLECGWGEPGVSGTISLRIRASGRIEVWKGTELVGDGTVTGPSVESQRQTAGTSGQTTVGAAATPGTGDVAGRFVNLYMIPGRRRELLIFSSAGGGFSHTFTDLAADVVSAVTPAGRFWWYVAAGKASVQCAPITFPASGYVLGPTYTLREAPHGGETFTHLVAWDPAGVGTVGVTPSAKQADGTTNFLADDFATTARIRVDLTGDGARTPFLYAADSYIGAYILETDDSEVADLSDYLCDFDFFVSEDPFGTRGEFTLRGPRAIATFCDGITEQSNRPFQLFISDDGATWRPFIKGFVGRPKDKPAAEFKDGGGVVLNDRAFKVVLPWRDQSQVFDELEYEDAMYALDYLYFTGTIEGLAQDAGLLPAEIEVESNTFRFPFTPAVSRGEWSEEVPQGQKLSELFLRTYRDYAASWYMGFYPTLTDYIFRLRSESTMPDTGVVATLDPLPGEFAVYRWEEEVIPPEITRVAVGGYDPRARTKLRVADANSPIEDPTPPPSSRPAGWIGTVRPLYVQDGRFTTLDTVERVRDELMARLSVARPTAESEMPLLRDGSGVPLWRGASFLVPGKGRYRIEAMSGSLKNEAVGFIYRKLNYVVRWVGSS